MHDPAGVRLRVRFRAYKVPRRVARPCRRRVARKTRARSCARLRIRFRAYKLRPRGFGFRRREEGGSRREEFGRREAGCGRSSVAYVPVGLPYPRARVGGGFRVADSGLRRRTQGCPTSLRRWRTQGCARGLRVALCARLRMRFRAYKVPHNHSHQLTQIMARNGSCLVLLRV